MHGSHMGLERHCELWLISCKEHLILTCHRIRTCLGNDKYTTSFTAVTFHCMRSVEACLHSHRIEQ
jgi:hypothetical protein